jgi:hypothetical protein
MSFDHSETVANLRSELQEMCNQRKHIEPREISVNRALSRLAREIEDPNERDHVLKEIQAARHEPAGLTESILKNLRETHDSLSPPRCAIGSKEEQSIYLTIPNH